MIDPHYLASQNPGGLAIASDAVRSDQQDLSLIRGALQPLTSRRPLASSTGSSTSSWLTCSSVKRHPAVLLDEENATVRWLQYLYRFAVRAVNVVRRISWRVTIRSSVARSASRLREPRRDSPNVVGKVACSDEFSSRQRYQSCSSTGDSDGGCPYMVVNDFVCAGGR